jgi:hypothetical protein
MRHDDVLFFHAICAIPCTRRAIRKTFGTYDEPSANKASIMSLGIPCAQLECHQRCNSM